MVAPSPSGQGGRYVWWTRDRVQAALLRSHTERSMVVTSSPVWDTLLRDTPDRARHSQRGPYPSSQTILRYWPSLRQAWRDAGVPVDRWRERWTEDERAFLRRWWGIASDRWIAEQLDRTVNALVLESGRMDIKSRKENARRHGAMTPIEMGRLFGVDQTTVVRAWAGRYGWLPVMQSAIAAGGHRSARTGGRAWFFCRDCVASFIRSHGWAYDWRKMQPGHSLTELAREINTRDPWLTVEEFCREYGKSGTFIDTWRRRGLLPSRLRPSPAGNAHGERGLIMFRKRDLPAVFARIAEAKDCNQREGQRKRVRRRRERLTAAAAPTLHRDERGVYWLPDGRGFINKAFALRQLKTLRAVAA